MIMNSKVLPSAGFTLVELVVVLVLIGLLSLVVFSRFTNSGAFEEAEARDLILSTARSAQLLAMGRSDVSLTLAPSGADWIIGTAVGGIAEEAVTLSADNLILETGSAASSALTCAAAYDTSVAADFEVDFDGFGNVAGFTNNSTTELAGASFNGVRICLNDDDSLSVCISPAGYAFAGPCDD